MKRCMICHNPMTKKEDELKITCSEDCHNKFVEFIEKQFGKTKRVTDIESGTTYEVPVRDIIEKGLKHEDLSKYPILTDSEKPNN